MKARFTLALFAVCVAAAAAVYFFDIRGGTERAGRSDRSKRLVSVEEEEITAVTVLRPSGLPGVPPESLIVERDGDAWRLLSPVRSAGDRTAVKNLVSEIAKAKAERSVADVSDWGDYGLADPKFTVFIASRQSTADTLMIGDGNPTGDFVFVRKPGRSEALLTEATIQSSLEKPVFELRDRIVLAFEKEDVRRLEIRRPGGTLVLEKENGNGNWEIRSPFKAAASASRVDEILNQIKWAEARVFVEESPKSLSRYGLDAPSIRLLLSTAADSVRKTLDVGFREDGRFYAAEGSRRTVVLVDSALVSALRKSPEDFRERKICAFEEWKVKRVEIRSNASDSIAFKKDASGAWTFDPPGKGRADGGRVNDLLALLSGLDAETFVGKNPVDPARYGLDPPGREIVLTGEGRDPLARILFGKDRDRKTVFTMNRSTGWVAAAPNEIMKYLTPSRTAWTAETDPVSAGSSGAKENVNKKP
jgi:hypothetical protein